MEGIDRKAFEQKIKEEIVKTETKLAEYKELAQPISPDNAIGRISRMDAINNKSINDAAVTKAKHKLEQLKTALGKLDDPSFGTCGRCGNPIQPMRVMLMPQSGYCVRCA